MSCNMRIDAESFDGSPSSVVTIGQCLPNNLAEGMARLAERRFEGMGAEMYYDNPATSNSGGNMAKVFLEWQPKLYGRLDVLFACINHPFGNS